MIQVVFSSPKFDSTFSLVLFLTLNISHTVCPFMFLDGVDLQDYCGFFFMDSSDSFYWLLVRRQKKKEGKLGVKKINVLSLIDLISSLAGVGIKAIYNDLNVSRPKQSYQWLMAGGVCLSLLGFATIRFLHKGFVCGTRFVFFFFSSNKDKESFFYCLFFLVYFAF